jgi:hypothetical protein
MNPQFQNLALAQQIAATLTQAACARLGAAGVPVDPTLAAEKGVVFETATVFKMMLKFVMEGDHLGDTSAAAWATGFPQGGAPTPAG